MKPDPLYDGIIELRRRNRRRMLGIVGLLLLASLAIFVVAALSAAR
jgi:hypothetical protein